MTLAGLLFLTALGLPTAAQKTPAPPKPAVRAITAFVNVDRSRYQIDFSDAVKFLRQAQKSFESHGYTVQTLRIATQPFPEYTKGLSREDALRFFKNIDGIAQQENLVVSIGPAYLSGDDGDAQADLLVEVLCNTKKVSGTVFVSNSDGVNWPAVKAAARVMKQLSERTARSEGNFHFAAIANVPEHSPFFPAAYHTGAGRQFSVGLQWASSVVAAVQGAPDLATAKRRMIDQLFPQAFDVEDIASGLDQQTTWSYMGLDLSPAPGKDASLGAAIESLSGAPFGASGTLTAVATITSALKEIGARHVGYSGLMLPVLEDVRIAERWNAGMVSMDALLSYSAVCGTGLDTIPLRGDISIDTLARIIGDMASLSVKWNKPLSARLLPVAGKHAGERTAFTDPNLINGIIQGAAPHN